MAKKKTFSASIGDALIKSEGVVMAEVVKNNEPESLVKSILNQLNGAGTIERLAFETDPTQRNQFSGVYRAKLRLIPDDVLKRIAIQDSLVSNIVRARQNHVAAFGRPRPDQTSTGFIIEANTGLIDTLNVTEKEQLDKQIKNAVKKLYDCGDINGVAEEKRTTFSEYLSLEARNAVVVGRIATEIVYVDDPTSESGKKFHHFFAADAGTIYKATKNTENLQAVRDEAYNILCSITGQKLIKEKYDKGDYTWVQVIAGRPFQAFTSDEMKVYNFYAVPDVELDGYPVTPIDTVITAVTTHINIVTHNKLYFQNGRASHGMLVVTSDDANPQMMANIKQQFMANINNVNNSFRMPVFNIGEGEEVQWTPIDTGGRDMEFQYLTDMNAREILTAFMMSPDELPGWTYLSRGTASQALSESDDSYKLTAARDVGIRPLLAGFEDFINSHLLPLIDPDLAKKARVRLIGLDAETEEKRDVRLAQGAQLWMNYDDLLQRVEKKPVGKDWGGSIPLNPGYKAYLDQYFTVGQILEHFCGVPNASKDPALAYRRDPFFLQWVQLQQQVQAQQQQAAQAAQNPQQPGTTLPGQDQQQPDPNQQQPQTENQKTAAQDSSSASGAGTSELARSIDQAYALLTKSEAQLSPEMRRLLTQQRKTEDYVVKSFEEDSKDAIKEILDIAKHHSPK